MVDIGSVGAWSAATGSVTPALPTGIVAGDILVVCASWKPDVSGTISSGWTRPMAPPPNAQTPQEATGGTGEATGADAGNIVSAFAWRVADGADTAPTVTVSSGSPVMACVIRIVKDANDPASGGELKLIAYGGHSTNTAATAYDAHVASHELSGKHEPWNFPSSRHKTVAPGDCLVAWIGSPGNTTIGSVQIHGEDLNTAFGANGSDAIILGSNISVTTGNDGAASIFYGRVTAADGRSDFRVKATLSVAEACSGWWMNFRYEVPQAKSADDSGLATDNVRSDARPWLAGATAIRDEFTREDPGADAQYVPLEMSLADGYGRWLASLRAAPPVPGTLKLTGDEREPYNSYRVDRFSGRLMLRDKTNNNIQANSCCVIPPFDATAAQQIEFDYAYHLDSPVTAGVCFQAHFIDDPNGAEDTLGMSWVGLMLQNDTVGAKLLPKVIQFIRNSQQYAVTETLTQNFGQASRRPLVGDRLRVTYDPATYLFTLDNLTLGERHGTGEAPQAWKDRLFNYGTRTGGFAPIHMGVCQAGTTKVDQNVFAWGDIVMKAVGGADPVSTLTEVNGPVDEAATRVIVGRPYRVELWEAGVFKALLLEENLLSSSDILREVTFDASILANDTGDDVEIRIQSDAYSAEGVPLVFDLNSVNWDVQYLVGGEVEKSDSDSSTSAEATTLDVALADSDNGLADDRVATLEQQGEATNLTSTDASTSADAETLAVQHAQDDTAVATEAENVTQYRTEADVIAAMEQELVQVALASTDSTTGEDEALVTFRDVFSSDTLTWDEVAIVTKPPSIIKPAAPRTAVGRASFDLQ